MHSVDKFNEYTAGFTGVDDPYERPLNCEVKKIQITDTHK